MEKETVIRPVAHIRTDFPEKFGIPRQSGLVEELAGKIIFESEYREAEAFRELEGFSHLWLIWQFSECAEAKWNPTVRPPRLGGNRRVGVFASRSPFRPNHLGLSSVKLEKIDYEAENGPILCVSGIDMMDGTPIFDVKPYLPVSDCHPSAREGYTEFTRDYRIAVDFPEALWEKIPGEKREALLRVLENDPRPGYGGEEKEYGVCFSGYNVRFRSGKNGLTVISVEKMRAVSLPG